MSVYMYGHMNKSVIRMSGIPICLFSMLLVYNMVEVFFFHKCFESVKLERFLNNCIVNLLPV